MKPLRAAVARHFESVEVVADPAIPSGYYVAPRVRAELVDALRRGEDLPRVTLGLSPEKNLTGAHCSDGRSSGPMVRP